VEAVSGNHRMRRAPVRRPNASASIRPDETDIVNVSDSVPTRVSGPCVRGASQRNNGAERRPNYPWIGKSDSGSVGRRMTCCDRERAPAMLASAAVRSFECAIGLSTKRLASWYCAPRRGSRALRLRRRLVGCIESARGTHGRGGRRDRAVDNSVYNMCTRCAHVRRSEASIAF